MKRELARPYIIVDGEGFVKNIEMFANPEDANRVTRCIYGENALALEYRYLVQAGDIYKDGIFYNVNEDGTETVAEYIPSDEENINSLQAENQELTMALADMIGGAM